MNGVPAAGSGDTLSGLDVSPCSNLTAAQNFAARQIPEPVAELNRYGRMLRPFPTRRLTEVLYYLEAEADAITRVLRNLLIEPPQTAEPWCEALYYLLDCLDGICDRAMAARPEIERMLDTADADAARAEVAIRALLALRAPDPCPACAGHGGSPDSGHCETCQGTGIDPADPASPL